MEKLNKEDSGWALARVWLDSLEETSRDFFGNRPKIFTRRAYENAAESWLRILENDYGIKYKEANTIKDSVKSYIDASVKGGLFEDSNQFELKEITPFRLEISIAQCPYRNSCSNLLNEGISLLNLTCARFGCFAASVKMMANIECDYEINSVNQNNFCSGAIIRE